jgi:hypothetical protein
MIKKALNFIMVQKIQDDYLPKVLIIAADARPNSNFD